MFCSIFKKQPKSDKKLSAAKEERAADVAVNRCLAPEGPLPVRLFRDPPKKAGTGAPRHRIEQERAPDKLQAILQGQENQPAPGAPVFSSGAPRSLHCEPQGHDRQHDKGAATGIRWDEQDWGTRAQQMEGRPIGQQLLHEPGGKLPSEEVFQKGPGLPQEKALPDSSKEPPAVPTRQRDKGKALERNATLDLDEASTASCKPSSLTHLSPLHSGMSVQNPVGLIDPSCSKTDSSSDKDKAAAADSDSSNKDASAERQHQGTNRRAREEGTGVQGAACGRVDRKGEDAVSEVRASEPEDRPSASSHEVHCPSLSSPLRHLLEQQQAVRAQLLAHSANDRWHHVLDHVDSIGELVSRNGSALGPEEMEALQSEVQAVNLFLKMEQEEDAAEDLDRQFSASLQEAYDEELAAQLAAETHVLDPAVECSICFEEFPSKDCVKAHVKTIIVPQKETLGGQEAQGPVSSHGDEPAPCSHWHCVDCLRQYAAVKVLESRTSRIPCTCHGCPGLFAFDDLEWMLGDAEREVYTALLAEDTMAVKVYCPFDGCNAVMECPEGERGPDSLCPVCKRVFCRSCRVAWHADHTCEEYASARTDGPLHALAKKKKWKPCPECHHMIERQDGCNFMACKCGCGFCYKCGTAYKDRGRTKANIHGKPGCKCQLFGQ